MCSRKFDPAEVLKRLREFCSGDLDLSHFPDGVEELYKTDSEFKREYDSDPIIQKFVQEWRAGIKLSRRIKPEELTRFLSLPEKS